MLDSLTSLPPLTTLLHSGLLYDDFSSTCVAECRRISDGVTPGSYRLGAPPAPASALTRLFVLMSSPLGDSCKSCVDPMIRACDAGGVSGCLMGLLVSFSGQACITAEQCIADTPLSIPNYPYCARCGQGSVRTADKTSCVRVY